MSEASERDVEQARGWWDRSSEELLRRLSVGHVDEVAWGEENIESLASLLAAARAEGRAEWRASLFPIQDGPAIPWPMIAPHDGQCRKNHGGQSLERIAERGGLCCSEALAVLDDRPWESDEDALYELVRRVTRWQADERISAARAEEREALRDGLMRYRASVLDIQLGLAKACGFTGPAPESYQSAVSMIDDLVRAIDKRGAAEIRAGGDE